MHRVVLLVTAVTLAMLGVSSDAAAYHDRDDDYRGIRLYGGLGLGFGGRAHIDATGPLGLADVGGSDDLITSVGGQVGVDVPVLRFLSLGAEARLLSFNTQGLDDNNVDRSKLLDLDFKPRVWLPLRNTPFELYLTVPIGLTVPFLADNFDGDGSADAKVGWNLGVGAGVNWWLTHAFALNVEPMFLMHWFSVDGPARSNADVTLKQFSLFLNAVFAI